MNDVSANMNIKVINSTDKNKAKGGTIVVIIG
jgi:hypothetical protein